MVFNGLQRSDLIVFNGLLECDLSNPVPISELERLTCLHYNTIRLALMRLNDYQMIIRERERRGQAYKYNIKDTP
jgi:predicted transcriptional regulator